MMIKTIAATALAAGLVLGCNAKDSGSNETKPTNPDGEGDGGLGLGTNPATGTETSTSTGTGTGTGGGHDEDEHGDASAVYTVADLITSQNKGIERFNRLLEDNNLPAGSVIVANKSWMEPGWIWVRVTYKETSGEEKPLFYQCHFHGSGEIGCHRKDAPGTLEPVDQSNEEDLPPIDEELPPIDDPMPVPTR